MNGHRAVGPSDADTSELIVVLERLVRVALTDEGVEMMVIRDADWYRVTLSRTGGAGSALLGTDARGVFSFTRDRVRGLKGLGVGVPDLARSAFGELIDQLARSAPDKVAFMRAVHARLACAQREVVGSAT